MEYLSKAAFRIKEFCGRNSLSETTYHKLKARGLGPREMVVDGMIRISADAERDWQRARENPTGREAADHAEYAAQRRERAVNASRAR